VLKVDNDLLERWNIRHRPDPDYRRLHQAILRQGVPDPLLLFEVNVDNEILSAILGETVQNPGYVSHTAWYPCMRAWSPRPRGSSAGRSWPRCGPRRI
jgi:hypothetical protein